MSLGGVNALKGQGPHLIREFTMKFLIVTIKIFQYFNTKKSMQVSRSEMFRVV